MTATLTAQRMLRAFGATDVGLHRTVNEDRFYVDAPRGIFIVIDGIGGHAAGDRAADTAIAAIRKRLQRQTGPVADRIREAITIANNEIHRLAAMRPEWHGMACVLTVAVVDGDHAIVGHVGDSRLYRIRGQQIEKITPDHSPIGEREDANELSELEAMRHPRRNEVYRDVGSEPHDVSDPEFVFLTRIDLPPDAALVICSDGLTDQVPAEAIRRIVRSFADAPEQAVRALIDAANDAGGKDNVTVVFVKGERFEPERAVADAPVRGERVHHRRARWLLACSLLVATIAGLVLGLTWQRLDWPGGAAMTVLGSSVLGRSGPATTYVQQGESITAAIEQAGPGVTVIVEPGEYRERLRLKDSVRVVSRLPRGATLRLPEGADERDPAIVAVGVADVALEGFRIVGDAATPLGTGVFVREAGVRLIDLEVSGAANAAIDLGAGRVLLAASDIHDNPGSALRINRGATPRLAHNVFTRNASSERSATAFVLEDGAQPAWFRNVFQGTGPEAIAGVDDRTRAALAKENWFLDVRQPAPRPAAAAQVPSRR